MNETVCPIFLSSCPINMLNQEDDTSTAVIKWDGRYLTRRIRPWPQQSQAGTFDRSESGLLWTSKSWWYCHITEKLPVEKQSYLWTRRFRREVLWNRTRPRSDSSLSLFEARTEIYLLQSMTNCLWCSKISKQSAVALWLDMGVCYPVTEQIWTRPHPCPVFMWRESYSSRIWDLK